MFFTRLPCPKWTDHDPVYLKESGRYFSLIGWIVGAISAGVFLVSNLLFSIEISAVLSIAASIGLTGAFHEDALADVGDGFGGGWTKEKIILIMKDPRLGTFGVLTIMLVVLLKIFALADMPVHQIPLVILSGHVLSRLVVSRMLARGNYISNHTNSKSETAASKLSTRSLLINFIIGLSILCFFKNWWVFLTLLPMFITEALLYRYYKKWIGGYNGDCIGAVQQITELVFYLSVLMLWKFI
ncbi:adenosylcobinamide-GDP ribazoletransferase [Salegentibacter flavus]|nr:adenosylcobinamide-GDP ribazoletransferase [Salegentibacter flavus]